MALSLLVKNIRALHRANTEKKAAEKREDALKAFFKEQAGGNDTVFLDEVQGLEVAVTREERTSVDAKAVREKHGDAFDVTTSYERITCRQAKEET